MKPEEEVAFYALVAASIEKNWEREMSKERHQIWWSILKKFSFNAVARAISEYIKHGAPYWPQVSDIVKIIETEQYEPSELYPQLEGPKEPPLSKEEAIRAIKFIKDGLEERDRVRQIELKKGVEAGWKTKETIRGLTEELGLLRREIRHHEQNQNVETAKPKSNG